LEQNPHILNALLPLQQDRNDASSIVISQGPPVTGQPVSEVIVASQISVEQNINESIDNQEDTGVMASQSISSKSNQGSGEVIDFELDQSEVTDQGGSQESYDVGGIEESSEVAASLRTDKAVNTLETINTHVSQETVSTHETVNSQEMINAQEAISNQEMVNAQETVSSQETINAQETVISQEIVNTHNSQEDTSYTTQAVTSSEVVLPPTNNFQDMILGDVMDTPQHKTLLDLWQHSFVLTHPSCVDCPSEARLLWHEPVMDRTPTHPLQHYTSSVNSDQVRSCDDVIHCLDDTSAGDEQCWCCLHGYCGLPTTTGELTVC